MTEKKQDILDSALKIFTEQGVRATTTKSIAIKANVSESLIFKHFGSKENLVEEIIKKGYLDAAKELSGHLDYNTPQHYIANLLEVPKILVQSNKDFWRMQYKIIPLNDMASRYHQQFINPCSKMLIRAFTELNYRKPEFETDILLLFIDGLWKNIAAHDFDVDYINNLIRIVQRKYDLKL
ncbi:TetR/AcrR family transcriptional regulator [Sphingobacterium sp. HJSM2_6]|uniref:TetR/AcrR family transcriptional regulator n=1 Tax=Sphingobacterium sp. HJSM2_6 TaxID=3366264 RepID=UPI003BEBD50F